MMKNDRIELMEYLSLVLVLSFFFLHNIDLVLSGVVLALFIINKNIIYDLIKSYIYNDLNKGVSQLDPPYLTEGQDIEEVEKKSRFNLVNEIEELGFIPSIDKNDNSNAA